MTVRYGGTFMYIGADALQIIVFLQQFKLKLYEAASISQPDKILLALKLMVCTCELIEGHI